MNRRAWWTMVFAAALLWVQPANGRAPLVLSYIEVKCRPKKLYCGETLTIEIKGPHAGAELAIEYDYYHRYLLSFPPGPKDQIPPVIPADKFAKMTRLRLRTDRAVGSPADGWIGDCVPRVKGPPELIFAATGEYAVIMGDHLFTPGIDYEEFPPAACQVEYHDYLRPKRGEQGAYEHPCHSGAADERERETDREVQNAPRYTPLKCEPKVLYKGDALAVDLPAVRDDYELGIMRNVRPGSYNRVLLMSFKPDPVDTIPPAVPFEVFRRTKQLKIATAEAKGSPATGRPSPCFKHVDGPSEQIFTTRGDYAVEVGMLLQATQSDVVGDCLVHYIDVPRPPAGSKAFEW